MGTLKKPTFVYGKPMRVEVEAGVDHGIVTLSPALRRLERLEIETGQNVGHGSEVEVTDKNLARANALMLEKLEMRAEEVGISGPTEERLVWAANEVMSMIGKDEFLSLYAHECRGSRFFKHKPRYLETRINLNWTQQVETRVSYHQIAELIARVEAKMHPSTQQKGGTPAVNTAPAAIKPGKRPTLIVDQHVLQYSWFSPAQEARMLDEINAGLHLRSRSLADSEERKREADTILTNVKMAFQVWFFHELGHLKWLSPGRLSRMFNLDEKDEIERIADSIDLLMPALEDWDLISSMDLFSRNREISGIKVIRAKPQDKVFTTYRNDLRMVGGNDSPYYRTISNYYDLARQRRQIETQTTTLKAQKDLIARSQKGFDREALQKDYVIKHVEVQKLQSRLSAKMSTMVKANMDRKSDLRLMHP